MRDVAVVSFTQSQSRRRVPEGNEVEILLPVVAEAVEKSGPPIRESHVEMDGAWALYEAWVLLQEGEIDAALVYGFGKSSPGSLRDVLAMQLDPYYYAPMWPDAVLLAALQARVGVEGTDHTEREMAEGAARG